MSVLEQVFSTGAVSPSIVGSTYLALSDIAQMKATKTNPDEHDIVTLPLLRRSGRTQGSIEVSINLTGATIQQMMYPLGQSSLALCPSSIYSSIPF